MKKLNLTTILIICCLFLSCTPKTEKKQPTIIYNTTQNYKFDDDEIVKRKTKDIKKKTQTDKDKTKKENLKNKIEKNYSK